MKKILALLLWLSTSSLFAHDYVCPVSFTCNVANDPASCTSAGGSPEFNAITPIGLLAPGKYVMDHADDNYDMPDSEHGCTYILKDDRVTRVIFVSAKGQKLFPNAKTPGSLWFVWGNEARCERLDSYNPVLDPTLCVFSDQYMRPKPTSTSSN